jgi:hypothetical protein
MTTLTRPDRERQIEIECLGCGTDRSVTDLSNDALGLCPACGYIGWTFAGTVTETELTTLHRVHLADHRPHYVT